LRCEFLRQFHAALVGCTIGFVEIDVGQLLGAAQRTALGLFDFRISRLGAVAVARRQERRDREAGPRVKSCSCWTASSPCDQAIMSLSRRLSSSAADADSLGKIYECPFLKCFGQRTHSKECVHPCPAPYRCLYALDVGRACIPRLMRSAVGAARRSGNWKLRSNAGRAERRVMHRRFT
jgi:hypothetical protein